MKEGWEYKTLGECCDILDKLRKPIKQSNRKSGSIPYYGATGLLDFVKDYLFDETLVLLGEDGAKWGAGDDSAFIISGKSWVNNHAHVLKPHSNLVDRYLVYYLKMSNLSGYITGVTVPKLNQERMRQIPIPVTTLDEQLRIVSYLDTTFANIDNLKSNASKALSEAKALFQAALAEAMMPKEGWEEKTLGEIGSTYTGTTPSKSHIENYGDFMPFIRPSEVNKFGDGKIHYDSEIKLSQEGCNNGRVFSKNSILMVCIGATIGKVGFTDKEVSCNQQINVLTPNVDYDYKFIYYSMNSAEFQKKVFTVGTSAQATLPIINKTKWENLTLKFPIKSQQHQIVRHLDTLSSKVRQMEENYRKTLAECDALKQAILRDVFE